MNAICSLLCLSVVHCVLCCAFGPELHIFVKPCILLHMEY